MNIIFLTLYDINAYEEHNIYCDLLREFIKNGHAVYCISPAEFRTGIKTHLKENGRLLKLRIGNIQKTNLIEKGISTLLLETLFVSAIKKYFPDVKFDLVLYSTPPITLASAIGYIKKRDRAKTYLMLKDIFPQNAVDMGMLHTNGIKSFIYKYFRRKEKSLYALSDKIGCMSPANADYVLRHNPEVSPQKVELCPNCIDFYNLSLPGTERIAMRKKYQIPLDKKIFIYGGNLGKPQSIPFLIECLKTQRQNEDSFFLIVGDGTEYGKLAAYFNDTCPPNMKLMQRLPKDDYDKMIAACDVGMIFLDYNFTIPNFPSRILSYMQAGLPIIACTDTSSDVGKVITNGNFGWWCESNRAENFAVCIKEVMASDISSKGRNAFDYLLRNYTTAEVYRSLEKSF